MKRQIESTRRLIAVSVVIILFLMSSYGQTRDLSGTWSMTIETGEGTGNPVFVLQQVNDSIISGTYSGMLGEAPVKGLWSNDKFHLQFSVDGNVIEYEGTISADSIKGIVIFGTYGEATFKGARQIQKLNITGFWDIEVKTEDGAIYPITMNLVQVGDTIISGTFSGAYGEDKVKGSIHEDKIKIKYAVEGYVIEHTGILSGNEMKGKVVIGSYSQGTFKGAKK